MQADADVELFATVAKANRSTSGFVTAGIASTPPVALSQPSLFSPQMESALRVTPVYMV